jgi:hypothetical protein
MHRQREWDEVVVIESLPGAVVGETRAVVLTDDRIVVDEGSVEAIEEPLAALQTEPPYRVWVVPRADGRIGLAARAIDIVELAGDPGGDELELVWDGVERTLRIDGEPSPTDVPELDRLGRQRHRTFVVTAHRLDGDSWEVLVAPL